MLCISSFATGTFSLTGKREAQKLKKSYKCGKCNLEISNTSLYGYKVVIIWLGEEIIWSMELPGGDSDPWSCINHLRTPQKKLSWELAHTGMSFSVRKLPLSDPCSCKQPFIQIPENNPNKFVVRLWWNALSSLPDLGWVDIYFCLSLKS